MKFKPQDSYKTRFLLIALVFLISACKILSQGSYIHYMLCMELHLFNTRILDDSWAHLKVRILVNQSCHMQCNLKSIDRL